MSDSMEALLKQSQKAMDELINNYGGDLSVPSDSPRPSPPGKVRKELNAVDNICFDDEARRAAEKWKAMKQREKELQAERAEREKAEREAEIAKRKAEIAERNARLAERKAELEQKRIERLKAENPNFCEVKRQKGIRAAEIMISGAARERIAAEEARRVRNEAVQRAATSAGNIFEGAMRDGVSSKGSVKTARAATLARMVNHRPGHHLGSSHNSLLAGLMPNFSRQAEWSNYISNYNDDKDDITERYSKYIKDEQQGEAPEINETPPETPHETPREVLNQIPSEVLSQIPHEILGAISGAAPQSSQPHKAGHEAGIVHVTEDSPYSISYEENETIDFTSALFTTVKETVKEHHRSILPIVFRILASRGRRR